MKTFGVSFKQVEHRLNVLQYSSEVGYSDGATNERKLLQIINSAQDLSSISWELHKKPESWVERYHLSMQRGSIIRCLPFLPNARVLEIGAGCGAITRSLGEKFTLVDAVEGSLNRARICASRCRDLSNVRVFAADINKIKPEPIYDIVVLVGVLEWSKGFIDGPNPFQRCLQFARQGLKEHGTILIAIENQLGLKYFLGIGEDHCGTPLESLHGYPTFHKAETLSRLKLSNALKEAGFVALRFMYPFPDYKLANVILTDQGVSLCNESIGYWVSRYPFEDYLKPERRVRGNHTLITCEVARAGLLGELSNSFLVLAAMRQSALPEKPWIVWSERLAKNRKFCSVTTLEKADSNLVVRKVYPYMSPGEQFSSLSTSKLNLNAPGPFLDGSIIELELLRHATAGQPARFLKVVGEWMAYVDRNMLGDDQHHIKPEGWDCIPRNLVRLMNGTLKAFDLEFANHDKTKKEELCARGLLIWYLVNAPWATPLNPGAATIRDHIVWALSKLFPRCNPDRVIDRVSHLEDRFQTLAGLSVDIVDISKLLNIPIQEARDLESQVIDLTAQLQSTQSQLQSTQSQLRRLNNHLVIGRIISIWRKYLNPDLPS